MKLVTFRAEGATRVGAVRDDEVVELAEPRDMLSLIDAGERGLAAAKSAIASNRARRHSLGSVQLLAPVPEPRGNVIAIGRNYQAHAEETARAAGKVVDPPTVFTKAVTSIAGPHDDIRIDPSVTSQVEEVELGLVMGQGGVNIPRERALDHVYGFVTVNDVSAPDIQFGWGGQYIKARTSTASAPSVPGS